MELAQLQQAPRQFSAARDWARFHTPRNSVLALVGEVGELAEVLQWRSDEEVAQAHSEAPRQIGDQLVDVLMSTCQIVNQLGINTADAVQDKMASNEQRYPAATYWVVAAGAPH